MKVLVIVIVDPLIEATNISIVLPTGGEVRYKATEVNDPAVIGALENIAPFEKFGPDSPSVGTGVLVGTVSEPLPLKDIPET